MRKLLATICTVLAASILYAADGGTKVEVKGPHICCPQCVKVVGQILKKVDGVSDVKADRESKTVTFTAKDDNAAKAGFVALIEGGFYGKATADGKELKSGLTAYKKGTKADVITVKDVHVCCGACQKAITAIFTDAKVSYTGKGPQKTVRIEGKDLEAAQVIRSLHKTGFGGHVEN
jgi:copper chaperone CopZ